jgi:ABC-type multidrug transport system ATPase subunit
MPEPLVEARELGCRFADGAWAFKDLDFLLYPGEIAVLAGPNGAGKTLLAKHLAGLLGETRQLEAGQRMLLTEESDEVPA